MSTEPNSIALSLFSSRMTAVCAEMGARLQRSAFSPNIRDRLDYSCAVFDADGKLCAQAAHIPVHLGSMAYAMADIVRQFEWQAGDQLVVNDPFLGGTHLPDVTLIAPVFVQKQLLGFVANRAHHADIGADSPGSMPISSRIDDEGLLLPPQQLVCEGVLDEQSFARIVNATRNPEASAGDFRAQLSVNERGAEQLAALVTQYGVVEFQRHLRALNQYGERLAIAAIEALPNGQYRFTDYLDDDGQGNERLPIEVAITIENQAIRVDFTGTSPQVNGNVNCPLPVTAAAVFYAFRCLLPEQTPACAGAFAPIRLAAPAGCLINAQSPAAVAAGNVETSTRIVDVVLGALAQAVPDQIPAASHGSMNNLALGGSHPQVWDYYETMGGGMGAQPNRNGLSACHSHMTNTLNTPVEVLEMNFPLRVKQYTIRKGTGGGGRFCGGDGLRREFEFTAEAQFTLLTERRLLAPWGLYGGGEGATGANWLNGKPLPPKCTAEVKAGDVLTVETAGGGGWGAASI